MSEESVDAYYFFWDLPARVLVVRVNPTFGKLLKSVQVFSNEGQGQLALAVRSEQDQHGAEFTFLSSVPEGVAQVTIRGLVAPEQYSDDITPEILNATDHQIWLADHREDGQGTPDRVWYCTGGGGLTWPALACEAPGEPLPDSVSSRVYRTYRDNTMIFPAELGYGEDTALLTVVEAEHHEDPPEHFLFRARPRGTRDFRPGVVVRACSLSAATEVHEYLTKPDFTLQEQKNASERAFHRDDEGDLIPVELEVPCVSQRADPYHPEAARPDLDFLDRIMIDTDPPTRIEVTYEGNTLKSDYLGLIVLVYCRNNGALYVDNAGFPRLLAKKLSGDRSQGQAAGLQDPNTVGRFVDPLYNAPLADVTVYVQAYIRNQVRLLLANQGAVSLGARDIEDFLRAPSFFALLGSQGSRIGANLDEIHHPEEFGVAAPEAAASAEEEALQHLARPLLSPGDDDDQDEPDQNYSKFPEISKARVDLWLEDPQCGGWSAAAIALTADDFTSVRAGLTPTRGDIGAYLRITHRQHETISHMQDGLDLLSAAGVLQMTAEHQLSPVGTLAKTAKALETLRRQTGEVYAEAYAAAEIRDTPTDQRSWESIATGKLRKAPIGSIENRTADYFQRVFVRNHLSLEYMGKPLDLAGFFLRIATAFVGQILDDLRKIDAAHKVLALTDPTQEDTFVILSKAAPVQEAAEGPAHFTPKTPNRRLKAVGGINRDEVVQWLENGEGQSPLTEQWRLDLLSEYRSLS